MPVIREFASAPSTTAATSIEPWSGSTSRTTGTWYVSALATGEDGDTTFVPQAAAFEVTR